MDFECKCIAIIEEVMLDFIIQHTKVFGDFLGNKCNTRLPSKQCHILKLSVLDIFYLQIELSDKYSQFFSKSMKLLSGL